MLVLTRKIDEQILIGDEIKVTLLRVRGNTVRIGIEAPPEIRIIRGELGPKSEADAQEMPGGGPQISRREQAFAHQAVPNRAQDAGPAAVNRISQATKPQLFVGRVKKNGEHPRLRRAPLAAFVAAS